MKNFPWCSSLSDGWFPILIYAAGTAILCGCGTALHPGTTTAAKPVAIKVSALIADSITNSPQQLQATVSYSNGWNDDASNQIKWSASGTGAVTDNGLFICTGIGPASASAHIADIAATTQTSCSNSAMPTQSGVFIEHSSDFAGPFPSWLNVKTVYGAKGDGTSDDTAALQAALNDQRRLNRVIWLPSGTYNISTILSISNCVGLTIIGEDPRTTTIKWMGAVDGTMLDINGCTAIHLSRISLDGNNTAGRAEHIWWSQSAGSRYPTFDLLADQTIKNTKVGLELGFAGETSVERVHFENDSSAGISTENWNAHNLNVIDSLFTGCGLGITNTLPPTGEGTFNVSNSVFVGSTVADMQIGNTGEFSVRRSLSVGSRSFFMSGGIGAPAQLIFQGNTIVSPSLSPIQIGTPSPLTLIDNTFLGLKSTMPIVTGTAGKPSGIFSIGNRATSSIPFSGNIGKVKSIDDLFSSPLSVSVPPVPAATYVPPLSAAKIFEVPLSADSSIVQALVEAAAALPGGGIVHFPSGQFYLDRTIVIPRGGPVEIVGDGPFSTTLHASESLSGAVLKVESMRARIAELAIAQDTSGNVPAAEGIQVRIPDEPGNEIIIDGVKGQSNRGLLVDGIDQALVEAYNWQLVATTDLGPESEFIGGQTLGSGAYAFGRINMFQGGTDRFTVDDNAQFLEEDGFHDSGESGPAIELSGGAGSVTVSGCAFNALPSLPTATIDNFKGSINFASISSTSPIFLGPNDEGTSLLLAGSVVQFSDSPVSSEGIVNRLGEMLNAQVIDNRPYPVSDEGDTSANWIEQMFGGLRTQTPRPRLSLASGVARIRIERVMIGTTSAGIHIMPAHHPTSNGMEGMYILQDKDGSALDIRSGPDCIAELGGSDLNSAWAVKDAPDGGIFIQSPDGSLAAPFTPVQADPVLATSARGAYQEWVVLPAGDGYFQIVNRATGQALISNGSGGCLGLAPQSRNTAEEWKITAANEGN